MLGKNRNFSTALPSLREWVALLLVDQELDHTIDTFPEASGVLSCGSDGALITVDLAVILAGLRDYAKLSPVAAWKRKSILATLELPQGRFASDGAVVTWILMISTTAPVLFGLRCYTRNQSFA